LDGAQKHRKVRLAGTSCAERRFVSGIRMGGRSSAIIARLGLAMERQTTLDLLNSLFNFWKETIHVSA